MADKYRSGSFYRICDRTGFKVRAEDTRQEWNGQIVDKRVFERRHPQDFVKGRRDDVAVPNPRPDIPIAQATSVVISGVLYAEDGDILQDEQGSALYAEA